MTTANDALRALRDLHKNDATAIARATTGIEPGFDPATGITWTEDGRARYRTAPASGGAFVGAHYEMDSQIFSAADNTVIDFATEVDDPDDLVTTGASWVFTAPTPGRYFAYAAVQVGGGVSWTLARLRLVPSAHSLILLDQVAGTTQTWLRGGALLTLDDPGETVSAYLYVDPGATITEGYFSIFQV